MINTPPPPLAAAYGIGRIAAIVQTHPDFPQQLLGKLPFDPMTALAEYRRYLRGNPFVDRLDEAMAGIGLADLADVQGDKDTQSAMLLGFHHERVALRTAA